MSATLSHAPVLVTRHGRLTRQNGRVRQLLVRASASPPSGDFFEDVKRIAKKIQGSLPVIGLISRLTAAEGGFDELSYPEFCRSVLERGPSGLAVAMSDLEKVYGRAGSRRFVMFCCWLAQVGTSYVSTSSLLAACRRIRVTEDLEVECDRLESAKSEAVKKYKYLERPLSTATERMEVAVDCLCRCALGLPDGDAVPDKDAALLVPVLCGVFNVTQAEALSAMSGRKERAAKYAAVPQT